MIIKVCQYTSQSDQNARLIEVFQPGDVEKAAKFFGMGRSTAPLLPQVQHFLDNYKSHPNFICTLVNAMGAGEFWGSNINGDYFSEPSLIHPGPVYGYETFYQAFPYKHHVNKNPEKSFGRVVLSVWHNLMKRVELIIKIDRERAARFGAQDVVDKLDKGIFPDVSMGCRVPYDMCSICLDWEKYRKAQSTFNADKHKSVGHAVLMFHRQSPIQGVSVTRHDYCDHLKTMLNKILPDGRKVYAINDYPRFFDISFVFIGADKTAKVMAKLGSANQETVPSWQVAEDMGFQQPEIDKEFEEKVAQVSVPDEIGDFRDKLRKKAALKKAEIIKDTTSSQFGHNAINLRDVKELPNEILDELSNHPIREALSTSTSMGIVLRPREFQRIMIVSSGNKELADEYDHKGLIMPPTDEIDDHLCPSTDNISSLIKSILMPFMSDRSIYEPVVKRRIIKITIIKTPKDELKPHPTPLLKKLSAAYNGYLSGVLPCLVKTASPWAEHPDIYEAVYDKKLGDLFLSKMAGKEIEAVGHLTFLSLLNYMNRKM